MQNGEQKFIKVSEDSLIEIARVLRNCKRIEHRIYQLDKQLYLGHSTAYNMIMKMVHPNYEEYKKTHKPNGTLADNPKLRELEEELDGKSRQDSRSDR